MPGRKVILKLLLTMLTLWGLTLLVNGGSNESISTAFSSASSQYPLQTSIRFAAIGDFGAGSSAAITVATQISEWHPDFIVTVGDNNYPNGANSTMDKNVGELYHHYIYPYKGTFATPTPDSTPGPSTNRFWPVLGNHDWISLVVETDTVTGPHMDYFTLPGNERYYEFVEGPVHFFVIDSDSHEPDGVQATSKQALWLQERLAASTEPWKLILMHHSPYSSSAVHGSYPRMRWPFKEWGVDAVMSGHDHIYERIEVDGLTYFVNGLGGAGRYTFSTPVPGSMNRYSDNHGAMLIEATNQEITFQMVNIMGERIDEKTLSKTQQANHFVYLPVVLH